MKKNSDSAENSHSDNEIKVNECPEFPYFGAKYPDARCIDGYLHDMDNCDEEGNLYLRPESDPCPFCNREEFIAVHLENEQSLEDILNWIEKVSSRYN